MALDPRVMMADFDRAMMARSRPVKGWRAQRLQRLGGGSYEARHYKGYSSEYEYQGLHALRNKRTVIGHEGLLHRLQDRLPHWQVEEHRTGYTESGRDSRIDWITPHEELINTKLTRGNNFLSLDIIKNVTMEELRYPLRNKPHLFPKTHGSGRQFVRALNGVAADLRVPTVMHDVQNPEWFAKNFPQFKRSPNDNWRTSGYNLYYAGSQIAEPWKML